MEVHSVGYLHLVVDIESSSASPARSCRARLRTAGPDRIRPVERRRILGSAFRSGFARGVPAGSRRTGRLEAGAPFPRRSVSAALEARDNARGALPYSFASTHARPARAAVFWVRALGSTLSRVSAALWW